MAYIKYGKKELEYLKSKDRKLAEVIKKQGIIKREMTSDPFEALIGSIIGQQISGRAAQTVMTRFYKLLKNKATPSAIKKCGAKAVQSCGMSMKKASYIIEIAEAALNKDIDFKNLHKLENEEIIEKLSSLRGVGVWTAEMILIFSLGRKDILSYGDFGIRRGISKLHNLKKLTRKDFQKYKELYSPYASIASFYLWTITDN
jgi:3-methyladenine DNA glycosylase/8-oxoguanine DNA glycosylase